MQIRWPASESRGCLRRGRSGGLPTQLAFAALHTGMHLAAAVVLMVLLELGVETCIKCAPGT